MKREIVIAGFGGQGVLSMGKTLAYAGLLQGKEVTWMPAYGPEQRGGTANVTVIVSDDPISSPLLQKYDIVVVLNQPSMDKFESKVKPGGVLLYDPNGMTRKPERKDIRVFEVPATKTAEEGGQQKVFNMIVLGGLLKIDQVVKNEFVMLGLKKSLPERHHHLLPANEAALLKGGEILKEIK